jgi:hypothetical protein
VDGGGHLCGSQYICTDTACRIARRCPRPPSQTAADVHDVKLISAPKGFKKFQTEPGSAGYTYSKTLTKPGVYKFICTLHEEDNMRMTITVRH